MGWAGVDMTDRTSWDFGRHCWWHTSEWERCCNPSGENVYGFLVCGLHKPEVLQRIEQHLLERPTLIEHLHRQLVERREEMGVEHAMRRPVMPGHSVVYFVEHEGFIKIGTTCNLGNRLRDIRKGSQMIEGMRIGPVRLLASMPGDRRHEQYLHGRFYSLRVEGEWFLPDSQLCDFIKKLPNVNIQLLDEIAIRHGTEEPG